jgi:hypothetical protein
MEHLRFNRHEIFTQEDRTEVLDILSEVSREAYKQGKSRYDGNYGSISNMLYGLFDGYLYFDLAIQSKDTLSEDLHKRVAKIWKKSYDFITANGESITAV